MQFHTSAVTLVNHPLQRVPIRLRSHALLSCQIVAPRLQLALVEGVALGADLEDDSIASIFLQFVQLVAARALHSLRTDALKLSVYALYPCPSEFTFLLRQCCHSHQQQYKY